MSEPTFLIPGDAPSFRFAVRTLPPDSTEIGDPFDLTDYNVNFLIKRSLQDADSAAEFNGTLSDGVAIAFTVQDGQLDVTVPASVTSNMRIGTLYPWYLKLTHSIVTTRSYVVLRGNFITRFPEGD